MFYMRYKVRLKNQWSISLLQPNQRQSPSLIAKVTHSNNECYFKGWVPLQLPVYINLKNIIIIIIIIIIINIKGWAVWPVPSPELQLLSPTFLRSPDCSLSLWIVVV